MVRRLNIQGDAQGDLAGHGGEHRAVFVHQMDSYHYWERSLGRNDFTFGHFGENFTLEGLPDNEVCTLGRSHGPGQPLIVNWTLFSNPPLPQPCSFLHCLARPSTRQGIVLDIA
jgi:MOSC domain-containing protein YiiM